MDTCILYTYLYGNYSCFNIVQSEIFSQGRKNKIQVWHPAMERLPVGNKATSQELGWALGNCFKIYARSGLAAWVPECTL